VPLTAAVTRAPSCSVSANLSLAPAPLSTRPLSPPPAQSCPRTRRGPQHRALSSSCSQ
jgi:hypothetical protein